MSTATVKAGKCGWTGSAKPNDTHEDATRLRAGTASHAFLRMRSPVPDGDSVTSASLRIVVASGAAGSVTFTLKRVTSRPIWDELTWNNEPTVASSSVTATVSGPTDGTAVTLDVTSLLQLIAGGSTNSGWRLEASAAVKIYGFDSANPPKLTVDSTSQPAQPTDLRPAGIGSLAKPHIVFSAPDVTGEADVQSVQVQLSTSSSPTADASGTWTSPTFDTAEVTSTTPDLDLATTAYSGLANAATIYWHVRWKSGGVWSPWSDTVSYTRQTWGTPTISNPSSGVVKEPTPPFIVGYAAGVRRYRMQVVLASDQTQVVAASDWLDGASATSVSWTPTPLNDSTNYVLLVDIMDANKRTPSPGDPEYLRTSTAFTATFDATVGAPTLSSVAPATGLPMAKLTFTRSTAPDSFTVKRDGQVVAADLDPADLFVSGTTYAWVDDSAGGMRTHTWAVAAVVNDKRSDWSSGVDASITPKGVWLVSQDRNLSVTMAGADISNLGRNDQVGVFRVAGARKGVVISQARGFAEGSYSGEIRDEDGRTAFDYYDDLEAIAELDEWVYLIAATVFLKVRVWNVAPRPDEFIKDGRIILNTSFAFAEVE